MQKYVCILCGYIYDPETGDEDEGIAAGTAFVDIPGDWVCPLCNAGKEEFEPTEQFMAMFLERVQLFCSRYFMDENITYVIRMSVLANYSYDLGFGNFLCCCLLYT